MLNLRIKPFNRNKSRRQEQGVAIIETIPVLFMLVLVFNFSLGFFGAVHTGILNSIGSYNYALETFRFKSNLTWFRPGDTSNYQKSKNRVHGTIQDGSEPNADEDKKKWPATLRAITYNYNVSDSKKNLSAVTAQFAESARNYGGRSSTTNIWFATSTYTPQDGTSIQTPRIWVKTVYGICLNADCE